jgi:hypothetical protein
MISQSKNKNCSKCGLVNWEKDVVCKRCNNNLSDYSLQDNQERDENHLLQKVPFHYKALFFGLYVFSVFVSLALIGGAFVFVKETGIDNIAVLATVVTLGFVCPLAFANFTIEGWKDRIKNPSKYANIVYEKTTVRTVIKDLIQIGVIVLALIITASSATISGIFFSKVLPKGVYSALGLGLPALVIGIGSFWLLSKIADFLIKKLEEKK